MSAAMTVPPWAILKAGGEVIGPTREGEQPTNYLEPGDRLAFRFTDGRFYIVAPSSSARVDWLTTVEAPATGGDGRRLLGPGIRSGGVVRLWLDPARDLIVLADGPIELAAQAAVDFSAIAKGGLWPQ